MTSRHAIARIMLEQGDYGEAEGRLGGSADQEADKMTPKDSAFADALLAVALSRQGHLAEAMTLAESALARNLEDVEDRLTLTVLAAEALAAGGRRDAARELVEATLQDARRTTHIPVRFEARLRARRAEGLPGRGGAVFSCRLSALNDLPEGVSRSLPPAASPKRGGARGPWRVRS